MWSKLYTQLLTNSFVLLTLWWEPGCFILIQFTKALRVQTNFCCHLSLYLFLELSCEHPQYNQRCSCQRCAMVQIDEKYAVKSYGEFSFSPLTTPISLRLWYEAGIPPTTELPSLLCAPTQESKSSHSSDWVASYKSHTGKVSLPLPPLGISWPPSLRGSHNNPMETTIPGTIIFYRKRW